MLRAAEDTEGLAVILEQTGERLQSPHAALTGAGSKGSAHGQCSFPVGGLAGPPGGAAHGTLCRQAAVPRQQGPGGRALLGLVS